MRQRESTRAREREREEEKEKGGGGGERGTEREEERGTGREGGLLASRGSGQQDTVTRFKRLEGKKEADRRTLVGNQ